MCKSLSLLHGISRTRELPACQALDYKRNTQTKNASSLGSRPLSLSRGIARRSSKACGSRAVVTAIWLYGYTPIITGEINLMLCTSRHATDRLKKINIQTKTNKGKREVLLLSISISTGLYSVSGHSSRLELYN